MSSVTTHEEALAAARELDRQAEAERIAQAPWGVLRRDKRRGQPG